MFARQEFRYLGIFSRILIFLVIFLYSDGQLSFYGESSFGISKNKLPLGYYFKDHGSPIQNPNKNLYFYQSDGFPVLSEGMDIRIDSTLAKELKLRDDFGILTITHFVGYGVSSDEIIVIMKGRNKQLYQFVFDANSYDGHERMTLFSHFDFEKFEYYGLINSERTTSSWIFLRSVCLLLILYELMKLGFLFGYTWHSRTMTRG